MICAQCGFTSSVEATRCERCGATSTQTGVVTAVVPVDTTGLPPGATFGAVTQAGPGATLGRTTAGLPGLEDTIGVAVTVAADAQSAPVQGGPLTVGQSFSPRYHIIKLLGVGGMGAVYQAWDAELGVAVALKVIRIDPRRRGVSAEAEKRFKQELLLARQVTHKNVVRIHDLGEISGIKYITMPYVQGDDLATILRAQGKQPVAIALRVARQIAEGLRAAHDAGVVHRDLKPANIMISGAGEELQALIMDFGISASTDEAASGGIVGTLEYMAPEQGSGGAVDSRADIYAFGLILYEMLLGPRPVSATTAQERIDAMKQRTSEGLPSARSVDEAIPAPLDALVMRCLERDPAARFGSTPELLAALTALDDAGEIIPEPRRVTKRLLTAAIVLVATMIGATFFIGRGTVPVTPTEHEPVPVLIADFENRSGDPVFEGAVEQTLALSLEEASYITVFKTRDARAIAAEIAPGKGSRITEDVGQLIARREGIKVLVTGTIEKRGTGYLLQVRATDPATGKPIATENRTVADKAQVLGTVRSLSTSVREALGESKTEMGKLAAAETVTASSLDAMRVYARAQDLLMASKFPEALEEFQHSVDLDPRLGRAYAGMAVIYSDYFKQPDKAEASYQAAMKHLDRMTDREKYRTLGTYYQNVARNYEKAIENFETLVKLFPADNMGHGSLALAYLLTANVPRAVAEGRKSLEIYPRSSLLRYNYAMYSMYAGDFATAITEASRVQKENPTLEYAWLPFALSKLAQGEVTASRDGYARMAEMGTFGASLAKLGEADLAMYFGRHRDAIGVLQAGLAADAKSKSAGEEVAQKHVALAEAYLALGQRPRAADAAIQAAKLSRRESTLFPAARVLLRVGREEQAREIAADLEKRLQRHTTAYARLISGEIAVQRGRLSDAIDDFRDAQKRHDSWLSRYLLGKTYVEAGIEHSVEALAELELCIKRSGETTDVFFYDMPTLRYLPPLYYWLARAQEGTGGTTQARQTYEAFLKLRAQADAGDELVADATRRLRSLQ